MTTTPDPIRCEMYLEQPMGPIDVEWCRTHDLPWEVCCPTRLCAECGHEMGYHGFMESSDGWKVGICAQPPGECSCPEFKESDE